MFPTKIVLATDRSASSRLAGRRAVELARAFGSELHVVRVLAMFESYHTVGRSLGQGLTLYEEDEQWARELLDGQVEQSRKPGVGSPKPTSGPASPTPK